MDQFPQDAEQDPAEPDFTCALCGGDDGRHDPRCPEYDEACIAAEERKALDEADSYNDEAALRGAA